MPESLPPDVVQLVVQTHAFAVDVLLPLEREIACDGLDDGQARARVVAASDAAGLYRLGQPLDVGGHGADALAMVAVRESMASHNPRHLVHVFGPLPGVLAQVREPLRGQYLKPLLKGRKRGGFAITEPRDAAHYTTAVRDKDELILTGRKSYVTGGAAVDFVNVVADIEGEGRAIVVVDVDAEGVSRERLFRTLDGAGHAAFRFAAVRIPSSHIVGTPGDGMRRALRLIGDTRLSVAAEAVGLSRWVVDYLTGHIKRSEANGKVSEAARLRYGALRIKAYAARSSLYRAARLAAAGENSVNEQIAAKVIATECFWELADQAMALVGGTAVVDDHPLASLYLKARVLRVSEGLSDTLSLGVARGALDLGKGDL